MRCKAVENLSASRRPSDTEHILASLNDRSPQVRCAAVRALAKAETTEAQTSLIQALQDNCDEVREAAARALGRVGARTAVEELIVCMKDPDAAVRIAAAGALRAIGWKPSTSKESAWYDITLGNIPAPAIAPRIATERISTGSTQDTGFYRRLADAELKERNDPRTINTLLVSLRGANLLARISAIHDLAQINDSGIARELLKLFRDPETEVRLAAAQAMAKRDDSPPAHFLGLLYDTSPEVRLAAVQFFGRIHARQVAEVLCPLLCDPCTQVRQAVADAIALD